MVVVNAKTQTDTSPLSLGTQELPQEKGTLSFSELLHGVVSKKDDKLIQKGAILLAINDKITTTKKPQTESLASLLKSETPTLKEDIAVLGLNPKVTELMTPSELKVLIKDAKEYLKNKITTLKSLSKEEVASLPKTLKGLMQVASKIGVNVTKITLEEVKAESQNREEIVSEKPVTHSTKKVKSSRPTLQTRQRDQEIQDESRFQE